MKKIILGLSVITISSIINVAHAISCPILQKDLQAFSGPITIKDANNFEWVVRDQNSGSFYLKDAINWQGGINEFNIRNDMPECIHYKSSGGTITVTLSTGVTHTEYRCASPVAGVANNRCQTNDFIQDSSNGG